MSIGRILVFTVLLFLVTIAWYIFVKGIHKKRIIPKDFDEKVTEVFLIIGLLIVTGVFFWLLKDEVDCWKVFDSIPKEKIQITLNINAVIIDTDDKELRQILLNAGEDQISYIQKGKNYARPCKVTVGDKTFELEMSTVKYYIKMGYIIIKPGGEKSSPLLCIFIAFFLCI